MYLLLKKAASLSKVAQNVDVDALQKTLERGGPKLGDGLYFIVWDPAGQKGRVAADAPHCIVKFKGVCSRVR